MIRNKDFNMHFSGPALPHMRGTTSVMIMIHPFTRYPIALSRTFPFQKPPNPLATRMRAAKTVVIA